ncbi:MAG: hypothetical protein JWP69_641 [Flaviaesturariibacter sp.]|nr:hypothetical protein [Flaviaesturariibacter sp.]
MKNIYLLLLCCISLTSCKKFIDAQVENAALGVVTEGQWKVTAFTKGTENKTSLFSPYTFQFQPNETVDAIRDSRVEKTGTWKVNIMARTITSFFNTSSEPLSLLNGTYTITNSSTTTVDASQTINGEVWVLHLDKI